MLQVRAGRFARRVDEVARGNTLVNGEREVLAHGREGDHVLVRDGLERLGEELAEIELERAPLPGQRAGMQLAEDAGRRAPGLARVQEGMLRALEARLGLQRRVERLDDASGVSEPAFRDRGDAQSLVRKLAIGQVDPGYLEQRDVLGTGVDVLPGGLDQARQGRRPQRGQLDCDRLRKLPRGVVLGNQRGRVDLGEAETDEHLLDSAAELLLARQRAEHLTPLGQREGDVLEPEADDLLDDVDLTRDVARAPGRHHDGSVVAVEAEPAEECVLLLLGGGEAAHRVGALRAVGKARTLGEAVVHVGVPDPFGTGQLDDQLRRERRGRPREMRVDTLLPAVRALGAQPEALGGSEDRERLEVRRFEQDVRRPLADLGLLSAHDPGESDRPLGVGDEQIVRLEIPLDSVQRSQLLALVRAADDDLAAANRVVVEGVQGVAERQHHVIGDVDDVRDRAHPGREQARFQPERRRTDPDVAEEPADVAGTGLEVLDLDLDVAVRDVSGVRPRPWPQRHRLERRGLAGDAVDGEQVGPVPG